MVQVIVDAKYGTVTNFVTATFSGWDEPNIIVAPVTGTVHEAFIAAGADGGAIGFTESAGSLEPVGFTTAGGTATEIGELKWQDSTVSLKLNPHDSLSGYVLDFFNVDGQVFLSLDASSATADAANGTLSWAVADAPWQDGDYLMLRIRETVTQPILPSTPIPRRNIYTAVYFHPTSGSYAGGIISLSGCDDLHACLNEVDPDGDSSYLLLMQGGAVRLGFSAEAVSIPGAVTDVWFEVWAATQSGTLDAEEYNYTVYSGSEVVAQVPGAGGLSEVWSDETVSSVEITAALSGGLSGVEFQINGPSSSPRMKLTRVRMVVEYDSSQPVQ